MKILKSNNRNIIFIFFISFISIIIDTFILNFQYDLIPAWDQGYHLSNAYKYSILLENINLFNKDWINQFWTITDSYRGPLTYFVSGLFMRIFGMSFKNAILSNHIFNLILIFTIYLQGKRIKNSNLGLISATIFVLSPVIINLRTDYLIDISLCSFITLNWLYLTNIFFKNKFNFIESVFAGFLLGFVFLVKPTGIVYFSVPLFLLLIKISTKKIPYFKKLLIVIIYLFSFLAVIFPWFSNNWLTIISSINNAWNWGINYQEGLEANTLSGWTFYLFEIYKIPGVYFSSILLSFSILQILKRKLNKKIILNTFIKKQFLWYSSFPISIYIIGCLMSSKDIRFIIPIYPQICILFGLIITNINFNPFLKRLIYLFLMTTTLFNTLFSIIKEKRISHITEKSNSKNYKYSKLHKEIIESVAKFTPDIPKVVGMIPDLKSLNTFNLEAEAIKQNKKVNIRQIISNEENYKKDLSNFDWFLIKSGYQGIMNSPSRNKLDKLIRSSESFEISRKWLLPEKEEILLMKRKSLNRDILFNYCDFDKPKIIPEINPYGIKMNIEGKIKDLENSFIFIKIFESKNNPKNTLIEQTIWIPDLISSGKEKFNCISLKSFNAIDNSNKLSNSKYYFDLTLLNKMENRYPINEILLSKNLQKQQYMSNKISLVEDLGVLLKEGKFDDLFAFVSLLNQSDPTQNYLTNSEKVYQYKFLETKEIKNLYAVAISQILQKKASDASETLSKIIDFDKQNPNLFLAKSITELYQFNFSKSENYAKQALFYNKDEDLTNTLKTILKITNIFQLKIFK